MRAKRLKCLHRPGRNSRGYRRHHAAVTLWNFKNTHVNPNWRRPTHKWTSFGTFNKNVYRSVHVICYAHCVIGESIVHTKKKKTSDLACFSLQLSRFFYFRCVTIAVFTLISTYRYLVIRRYRRWKRCAIYSLSFEHTRRGRFSRIYHITYCICYSGWRFTRTRVQLRNVNITFVRVTVTGGIVTRTTRRDQGYDAPLKACVGP